MFKKTSLKIHENHPVKFFPNPGNKAIIRKIINPDGTKDYVWMNPKESANFSKQQRENLFRVQLEEDLKKLAELQK